MPEDSRWSSLENLKNCFGICSDNIAKYKNIFRQKIKLVVLDIDGVMTDGTKVYDECHIVLSKSYNDKDFTAIKRMKKQGIEVCFLSGDERINKAMANVRKIDSVFSRNKKDYLDYFKNRYSVDENEIAFIGDDYFDLGIMKKLVHNFCPMDSPKCVRNIATVLPAKGGDGLVSVFFDEMVKRGHFIDNQFA
jgi:3-deoxy-D-manno-octulosonate 8-phosphate phosphatase (KDO 8-P phosphatase)